MTHELEIKAVNYLGIAVLAACCALAPFASEAQTGKKVRVHHQARVVHPPPANPAVSLNPGAAGGNSANSMSGSNSAAENAEGRTGGGMD